MSSKGPWEPRVKLLLPERDFPYVHKCPDAAHAGQAKIDFIAGDVNEHIWGIEVKWVQTKQYIFHVHHPELGVTKLQARVLDKINNAWVAVGYQRTELFVYLWDDIKYTDDLVLDSTEDVFHLMWTGPKAWEHKSLLQEL